jgi:hypothetical protein
LRNRNTLDLMRASLTAELDRPKLNPRTVARQENLFRKIVALIS